jgi:hypothetical protein
MAIGTTAAILGGAALLGGGSALASSSANKNARAASADATATARENNALTREIYGQNQEVLRPFIETGTSAGGLLNDFYGIPQAAPRAQPAAQSAFAGYGGFSFDENGNFVMPQQVAPAATAQPAPDSRSAFANFIANSDYGFQQQEGGNAVNSGFAAAGTVQSGAAMRALERYRQNLQSGFRREFASGLANQQGVGLSAAGAQAGVSTNFGNTIAASNTAASDARANAALSQQNVFGNALGTAGGALIRGFG